MRSGVRALFIEVPTLNVQEHEDLPEGSTTYIYEHLRYALSLPSGFPLPAIRVTYKEGRFVVTDGHRYLRIARDLMRPRLRAILSSDPSTLRRFQEQLPENVRVIPKEEFESELRMPVTKGYHVYFFERRLGESEKGKFQSTIIQFFDSLDQ